MSRWTISAILLLLLQTSQPQAQQVNTETESVVIDEAFADTPRRVLFAKKKDWYITQDYSVVFSLINYKNACSDFYGGPRAATTVLNDFVAQVKPQPLLREISFQMAGNPRFIRNDSAGVLYRLFARTTVNTNGSFYQRRVDPMRNVPADVGSFLPGSRRARALILLHELAHLIEGENGTWLIPDDGYDVEKSRANTLRIQKVCRAQLDALR